MIRANDGLDYQDLTHRLLDEPANTPRNRWIASYRKDAQGDPRAAACLVALLALPTDASEDDCLHATNLVYRR